MKKLNTAALCTFIFLAMSVLPLHTVGATVRMATEAFVINKVSSVSNYIDRVVDDATASMATETFVTNKVSEVSNYVDRVVGNGALVKRIAMFIIPVNNESSSFTGFELKASTNNFSHAFKEETRLQFYSQSEVADTGADYGNGNNWDKMKMYVGTKYGNSWDTRAYTKIENTIAWEHKLRNVVVLVDTSCIVKHHGDWLREDNEDLMWCYLRNMNNDVEYEDGTTTALWHPISPVRWFSKLPNWAVQ